MENLSKVQELINAKADKRLKDDIRDIHNVLCNGKGGRLLGEIKINIGTSEEPLITYLNYILNEDRLGSIVFESHKERYRDEESKEFLKKVESLREDVDNLLDNQFNN